ncbi:hypothetical protein H9Q69_006527 [Fusarium xylarioides]|uniref:Uncharacterized protein n=1 Tax=Fusarium xylarioides TaxID=221167 RepID=A0A9P7I9F1_9HYPO|nr:hypothetical protein H9Q70_007718 [Fusarium xylarioides]KAG5771418.1 hypothetical protein H9Q72_002012 [Fusarium xylarioides]KAG5794426.1 hypothetical protein H9Q69_006527 [Fusarium xylarioides]
MAASTDAIERIFIAKKRKAGHSMGVIGTYDLLRRLYDVPDEKYTIVRTFTEELGLTVAFVGKIKNSAADLVINYGRQKWHLYGRAGTILDLDNERVLRIGANYENVREKLIDLFGWSVPEDPDYDMTGKKTIGFSINASSDR